MQLNDLYEKQAENLYNLIMSTNEQWRKDWTNDGFLQQSGKTTNAYKNINQLNLFASAVKNDYKDPRWLTFNQIQEKGYKLEKGSKSEKIAFASYTKSVLQKDENDKPILDENGKKQYKIVHLSTPVIQVYNVFNASKIEGIEPFKQAELTPEQKEQAKQQNYQDADKMIQRFCEKHDIKLKEIASDRAFFQNGSEEKTVVVPLKAQFSSLDNYYATVFHELGHATKNLGIRINQETDTKNGNVFGSKNYAKEELTAELTSLFLCKEFKIDSSGLNKEENNSMAYLKGWLQEGKLDKEDLSIALREAHRATKALYGELQEIKQGIPLMKPEKQDLKTESPKENKTQGLSM